MGLFGYLCDGVTSIIKQKENQPAKTIDKSFIRKTKSGMNCITIPTPPHTKY